MENALDEVKEVADDLAPPMESFGVYLKTKQLKIID
ncbi:hypothetical protein CIB43_00552 [Mesomycoplasma hyopneumoniae]|nr:hypothetical protein CIB43_00552 [Mesomycoplasma hyopneumoniae]